MTPAPLLIGFVLGAAFIACARWQTYSVGVRAGRRALAMELLRQSRFCSRCVLRATRPPEVPEGIVEALLPREGGHGG